MHTHRRFLTADIAAVPAAIKRRYEDFVVEEIPAYEPSGDGSHTYFRIEKAGLATMRAVNDIARALGVPSRQVGMAGLKDARAVTRQMLSVEHVDPARVAALKIPRIRVLDVSRHGNKLRIGHLRGNRFIIRLRETDAGRIDDVRRVLDIVSRRGVPNYFGVQRFGLRGDTWEIGRALLHDDFKTAVDLLAGSPGPHDEGPVKKARELFARGEYERAADAWPWGFRDCVRVCRTMANTRGNTKRAMLSVDRKMLQFFVSAYQSWMFNAVVAARIDTIDRVVLGDLAYKHDHGAVFRVERPDEENPRAERFEISATGPLIGPRMTQPADDAAEIERVALQSTGADIEKILHAPGLRGSGGRRPLRFQPQDAAADVGADDAGPFIELRFTLASGCYATSLLDEICKDRLEEGRLDDDESDAQE